MSICPNCGSKYKWLKAYTPWQGGSYCSKECYKGEKVELKSTSSSKKRKGKENLSDREKLEIEHYVDRLTTVKLSGTLNNISGVSFTLSGVIFLVLGFVLIFIFWPMGLIMLIFGLIISSMGRKGMDRGKTQQKEKKEKLIKQLQLKALRGENWKD